MKTLSACLIIKNEELVIQRCIESIIPICDEIIIVDTGSNDKTLDIINDLMLKHCKIKLFHFKWINDFSAARNYSFQQATSDYLMWVDADEVFLPNLNDTILALKEKDFLNNDTVSTNIQFYYNEDDYNVVMRERIILRENNPCWKFRVHEQLIRATTKNDLNEFSIPFNEGYVFHEKKKESNFTYYFQIYCDALNKNNVEYKHHNLYYLTWMASYYDKILAKIFTKHVFTTLPEKKYDIDYRTWFKYNLLSESEFNSLEILSLVIDNDVNKQNFIYLLDKAKTFYEKGEYMASFFIFEFLYMINKDNYNETIFEYLDILYWKLGMIKDYIDISEKFKEIYPNNKMAIQNKNFADFITKEKEKTVLIINLKKNMWKLPHILYTTKNSVFNKRIVITSQDISDVIDDSIIIINNNDENLISKLENEVGTEHKILYIDEDAILDVEKMIFLTQNFILSSNNLELNEKNCIFTKNIQNILNII